jgi:hypothetical protein
MFVLARPSRWLSAIHPTLLPLQVDYIRRLHAVLGSRQHLQRYRIDASAMRNQGWQSRLWTRATALEFNPDFGR